MTMPHDMLVGLFLLLLALLLLGWLVVAMRRSPYTPVQTFFYWIAVFIARVLWRADVPDRMPIPPGQGAVLVCNHRSSIDPFFVQLTAHRIVHWMVAKEYCSSGLLKWFLVDVCGVIPVSRGGIDTAATKAAIRLVSKGEVVGMFPEGRINTTDRFMLPARPGAVLVALKARAPIVPCYIGGSPYGGTAFSPFLMRARARLVYGEPIDLSAWHDRELDVQTTADITRRVLRAIAQLAGHHDYEPELAGRQWNPRSPELTA